MVTEAGKLQNDAYCKLGNLLTQDDFGISCNIQHIFFLILVSFMLDVQNVSHNRGR